MNQNGRKGLGWRIKKKKISQRQLRSIARELTPFVALSQ